jgi:hypothetical protein
MVWGGIASAAVSITDQGVVRQQQKKLATDGQKVNGRARPRPSATGSVSLIDAGGLKYFINTNITFNTTSSASGAMSEASYTGPHSVTTLNGGVTSSTLNDAFDGYNSICFNVGGPLTASNCATGSAFWTMYNQNGAAVADNTCIEAGTPRQYVFPTQTSGSLAVQRKVYVPSADTFGRWLNYFTNTGGVPLTVNMGTGNNLGSDNNTVITGSSIGTTSPITSTAVTWISSFQNYSGTTSTDVRLGHVLQQTGAAVPLAFVNFVNGDDNPFWGYRFTVPAGQTVIIANFVTGQNSKAAASQKAGQLASSLDTNAYNCVTPTDAPKIANFVAQAPAAIEVPTLGNSYLAFLAVLLAAVTGLILWRRRLGR